MTASQYVLTLVTLVLTFPAALVLVLLVVSVFRTPPGERPHELRGME